MMSDRKSISSLNRAVAALFGALVGLTVGAVLAANIVIFAGIERGYEAGLREVFDQRPVVAVVVVLVLVASPIVGVTVALRRMGRTSRRTRTLAPKR